MSSPLLPYALPMRCPLLSCASICTVRYGPTRVICTVRSLPTRLLWVLRWGRCGECGTGIGLPS
eukprot:3673858-Rhodomonas_salina.3